MKTKISKYLVGALLVMMSTMGWAAEKSEIWPGEDYRIGPGDVLTISVWKEEALTRSVVVLPDGRISFPLIGQLTAAGKTVDELTKEVKKQLNRFVPDVELSLVVDRVNSMVIYLIGRLNGPGRFALTANIDVMQALAMAGGLNPFAKRSKIKIFRKERNQTRVYNFDYDDVVNGENLEQNIQLRRGDLIVVP
jgi:polysaccharide export outer membrane protein